MIKYLFVQQCNSTRHLPVNISDIKNIPMYDDGLMSKRAKMTILLEQSILARSVCDMGDSGNQFNEYNKLIASLFEKCKFNEDNLKMGPIGISTRDAIFKFILMRSNDVQIVKSLYDQESKLLDDTVRILPDNFVVPYLRTVSKSIAGSGKEMYYNPVILKPHVVKLQSTTDVAVKFTPITFTSYNNTRTSPFDVNLSNGYRHLLKMTWTGKSWKHLADTIQSFSVFDKTLISTTFSSSMHNAMFGGAEHFTTKTQFGALFVNMLAHLNETYDMDLSDLTSLKLVLEGFGYKDLDYFTLKDPTVSSLDKIEKTKHASFFKTIKHKYGMEASKPETQDTKATNPGKSSKNDPDADEDDPDTNPDNIPDESPTEDKDTEDVESTPETDPENADDADAESTNAEPSDAEPTNDESIDDDMSTDTEETPEETESSSTTGSSTDTPEVPEDPMSVSVRFVSSDTADDYFEKLRLTSVIETIISDPPKNMSSEIVSFLSLWVTQWINFVDVDTTKDVLSKLNLVLD